MLSVRSVLAGAVVVPLLALVPAADAVAAPNASGCVMFCDDPKPAPGKCVMLCDRPPVPPADAQGCRLFCELGKPEGKGVV
ncbi:hypothetical protein [Nocardia brevicatena]|uniref:hypothetical protein n=1 Tax=Nocardia brevicatena TaxID=37327 RepID=UPI00031F358A|nr:hypothetical protein [Nocardia brevicatena]